MSAHLERYGEMRQRDHVVWDDETESWYVGRFPDVWDLLGDARLGVKTSEAHLAAMTVAQREVCRPVFEFMDKWPVFTDEPFHSVLRRITLPSFTKAEALRVRVAVEGRLAAREHEIAAAEDVLRSVLLPSCCDALMAFLGLPAEDIGQVPILAEQLIAFASSVRYDRTAASSAAAALGQFREFAVPACRRGTGVFSLVLRQAVEAGTITWDDVVSVYGQIVTGFLQPTLSALAYAVDACFAGPGRAATFNACPRAFISESVRLSSPFHFAPRRARGSIEIGEATIPAGSRVVLLLVAANRDPDAFPDPGQLVVNRARQPHVGFGRGRYACVGARMASEVIEGVVRTLTAAFGGSATQLRAAWNIRPGSRMPAELSRL